MSICQEEMPECPLCMEAFEVDDLSFFPCTCGYQICRFCWHRIRTDESSLCPACRKPYPEDPAQFKPLTDDEVHNIKKDRRLKEIQRKQKSAENRKHLANVRVIQKNLVFVVGLSQRLADPDVLRKHEYFGKFGKIHKVVINQSTSYIGSQGPSASAYVTYLRTEDALHAIGVVNNLQVDNRTLKASLGTTKYCSHFLKGTQCTKADCMYLHDLGDEAASFSKEDIQQGKHLIYEQKLIEQYSNSVSGISPTENIIKQNSKSKSPSPPNLPQHSPPQHLSISSDGGSSSSTSESSTPPLNPVPPLIPSLLTADFTNPAVVLKKKNSELDNGEAASSKSRSVPPPSASPPLNVDQFPAQIFTEILDLKESEHSDDDLGFDPWDICSKGLADMMEKEKMHQKTPQIMLSNNTHMHFPGKYQSGVMSGISNGIINRSMPPYWANGLQRPKHYPPHMLINNDISSHSKLMQLLESQNLSDHQQNLFPMQQNDNQSDSRQENFKALLPNINISFSPSGRARPQIPDLRRPFLQRQNCTQNGFTDAQHNLGWPMSNTASMHNGLANGLASDPAIISTGIITDGNDAPHWMESIHKLTEDASQLSTTTQPYHFQPLNGFANNIYNNAYMNNVSPLHAAAAPSRMPPPGFNNYGGINPFVSRQPVDGQHEMPTI